MTFGTLDIEALRGASQAKREQVIDGLRDRDDPVLRMRDLAVEGADARKAPQIARATGSPWIALASENGNVVWYRRQNTPGDPVVDVLVEVVAALHGDAVLDAEFDEVELPA